MKNTNNANFIKKLNNFKRILSELDKEVVEMSEDLENKKGDIIRTASRVKTDDTERWYKAGIYMTADEENLYDYYDEKQDYLDSMSEDIYDLVENMNDYIEKYGEEE